MSVQQLTLYTYVPTSPGSISRIMLVSQAVTGPAAGGSGSGDMLRANNLSDVASTATSRTNLGLGTAATQASGAFATAAQGATADAALAKASNLADLVNTATARVNLGLVIGTNVQAWDADLDLLAAVTVGASTILGRKAAGAVAAMTPAEAGVVLGLGTAALTAATAYATAAQGTTADAALPRTAAGASVTNLGSVTSNLETANVTGTKTADLSTYNAFDYTMTANTTFTFANWATSGKMGMFTLILRGAFTPTLPAAVKWNGGSVPTYTTPAMYVFTSIDAGTTVLATQIGKAFS